MAFGNGSNYDYYFIIKQLAEEFKGQSEHRGENNQKYITFLVPIEKQENGKTIKCKIKLVDSVQFMTIFFSSLIDNLAEDLRKGNSKDFMPSLEHMTAKDGLLIFKCVNCTKTYEKKV